MRARATNVKAVAAFLINSVSGENEAPNVLHLAAPPPDANFSCASAFTASSLSACVLKLHFGERQ